MFGHLNRDPWPKREWLDPRPNLQKWVEKMARGEQTSGEIYPNDEIPPSIMPMVKILLSEFIPLMQDTADEIKHIVTDKGLTSGSSLPRATKKLSFKMLDGTYSRGSFTYSVWRMQRIQEILNGFSEQDKASLKTWLAEQGQPDFLAIDYGPKLVRKGLVAALA